MKRSLVYLIILVNLALVGSIFADTETATEEGIEISVSLLPDEIKGFKTFDVTLKSSRTTDHSVQVEIMLNNNTVKEPAGARGKCTVMVPLKGGSTINEKKHCKETSASNSFSIQIKKVFSKIF